MKNFTVDTKQHNPNRPQTKHFLNIIESIQKQEKRLEFTIKESTRKCDKKEYKYTGKRFRLEPPVETTIAGKTIIRKFKNVIEIAK